MSIRLMWLFFCIAAPTYSAEFILDDQSIVTESNLMSISLRSDGDIWVGGSNNGIFRSIDGGQSWLSIAPPKQADNAQFRDIQALNDGVVILMSAGEGLASSIYRTTDNGDNWQRVLQANHEDAFFDCLSFTNERNGWLYGDSIEGELFVLKTVDGGKRWKSVDIGVKALIKEGGFASSGTCINSEPSQSVLIGTGNAEVSRLLVKQKQWQVVDSPLKAGEAAGIFSLQRNDSFIYAAGGSLKTPTEAAEVFQYGGVSNQWTSLGNPLLTGAIYGSALFKNYLLVTNPDGISAFNLTHRHWMQLDNSNVWAIACNTSDECWGVGSEGNVRHLFFSGASNK